MRQLVSTWQEKQPQLSLTHLDEETCTVSALDEALGAQGLFTSRCIIVLDQVLDAPATREIVQERLQLLAQSENVVLCIESMLSATVTKMVPDGATLEYFALPEQEESTPFNRFAIADALAARNRRDLWLNLHRALAAGAEPEEIAGLLFWQAKALTIARHAASAKEAGMKQYPFEKARRASGNYTEDELAYMLWQLLTMYHEAHRGGPDLTRSLEQFTLTRWQ
jgi:DNA polymerase III delta subunit